MLAAGACCYTAPMTSEAPARPRARRKLQLPGERGWGGARGWMGCRSPGRDFPTVRGAGCSGLGAQWGLQGRDPCAGEGPLCRGETEREQGSGGARGRPCCGSGLRLGWRPPWGSVFADPPRQAGERPSAWGLVAILMSTPWPPLQVWRLGRTPFSASFGRVSLVSKPSVCGRSHGFAQRHRGVHLEMSRTDPRRHPAVPVLGKCPKETVLPERCLHAMSTAASFTRAKVQKQPTCPRRWAVGG